MMKKVLVAGATGYFSDMSEFLKMAEKGRVYLIGKGKNKMNPIHGADLAKVCVNAALVDQHEISVGGPEIFSYREIAKLAFSVIGKKPKIVDIPSAIVNITIKVFRAFSVRYAELFEFFSTAMQNDSIAPAYGSHYLKDYYEKLLNGKHNTFLKIHVDLL